MAKDKPVKVLIAVAHAELDPTRDISPFQSGFNNTLPFKNNEEQWEQEGPILKVARKIFTKEDCNRLRTFILYTRLSQEGMRKRDRRIGQGIPGPRVPFEHAEKRANLTKSYLKNYLQVPEANIRLMPLDFDDENASNIGEWLKTIRSALDEIKKELSSERSLLGFEFNFVYSGASQAREVIMGCLIGGVMDPSEPKLWMAPDPVRVPLSQAGSFEYEVPYHTLAVSPPQRERELAEKYALAVFNYGSSINIYVWGTPLSLGNLRENKKALLLYELALARKGLKYTTGPAGSLHRSKVQLPGVDDDYKSKLRWFVNDAVSKHTEALATAKGLSPISCLIKTSGKEWYLDLPPDQIYVA